MEGKALRPGHLPWQHVPMELDRTDRRILAALQEEGRLTNVELAERIALSPSPCLRRVKRLEAAGILRGYRAVLAREAVGLGLTVFVEIKVERHSRENAAALQEALAAMPEVVACHMVSGTADFLAEIVVADLRAYEALLTERLLTLPMIADIRSNMSLRRIKSDTPLPLPSA
ncbi:transcriptional regulator, AsnC family [Belnapia rosea]|nr:transcriptional regulator, AsnC family [Belnapia rosea]